jgi:hypothetical protein
MERKGWDDRTEEEKKRRGRGWDEKTEIRV